MARAVKTFRDYFQDVISRRTLADTDAQLLRPYARSLEGRFSEVEYARRAVEEAADAAITDELLKTEIDRVTYHCTVFWSLAYSTFDILANAANAVHGVSRERDVSFHRIASPAWDTAPILVDKAVEIRDRRRYYKRLKDLRNCAMHRRAVYLERTDTQAHGAYDADSTGEPTIVRRWFGHPDPYAVGPIGRQGVDLIKECASITRALRPDLVKLIRAI